MLPLSAETLTATRMSMAIKIVVVAFILKRSSSKLLKFRISTMAMANWNQKGFLSNFAALRFSRLFSTITVKQDFASSFYAFFKVLYSWFPHFSTFMASPIFELTLKAQTQDNGKSSVIHTNLTSIFLFFELFLLLFH